MNLSESAQNHFPGMGVVGGACWGGCREDGTQQAGLHFPSYHASVSEPPQLGSSLGRTALGLTLLKEEAAGEPRVRKAVIITHPQ